MAILVIVIILGWLGLLLTEKPNFQEFKPTVLPNSVTITTSDYYLLSTYTPFPPYKKGLNINLSLANSWISESKINQIFNHTCRDNTPSEDCKTFISSKGQQYQLVTGNDEHANQTVYEISFVKDGTAIWATMRTNTGKLNNQNWGSFVDSFKPVAIKPTRTIHHNTKGP